MPTGGFESARYDLTLQSEISDALPCVFTSKISFQYVLSKSDMRNPQGITDVERYADNGTNSFILAVKLSLDQESNNRK